MPADLRIALAHGGTFLVAAGFQHGVFAVLVLDAQHGLLEFFLLFQLLGVGEKIHLIDALVRRDLVGVDGNAPHRQRRVGDALKQLCAFVDEGAAQIGRGIEPDGAVRRCKPGTDLDWFAYWKDYCENWLLSLGIKKEHLRLRDHEPAELAFYSRATTDIEYAFPFTDWGELWGIADRTNYDLTRHQEASGKSLEYFDSETNEHYIPYVIEPSLGCDRVALAFLCEAYDEEHLVDAKGKEDVRTVLHLHPALAPYKCAVLPLSKKLGDKAMEIRNELSKYFMVDYDDTGSIGKRYRREDEIGTPYCITVDFDTVGDEAKGIVADNCVTVRDRDTMEQVRMPISELKSYIESKIEF